MDQAIEKGSRGEHGSGAGKGPAIFGGDCREPAILQPEAKRRPFDHREVGLLANLILHRRAIETAIGLCPRPANGRSARAIEQAKLNAGAISDTAHQTIHGVDLTHQVTFAQSPDGRIAGHLSDRGEVNA